MSATINALRLSDTHEWRRDLEDGNRWGLYYLPSDDSDLSLRRAAKYEAEMLDAAMALAERFRAPLHVPDAADSFCPKPSISREQIEEWRVLRGQGMQSEVGEYTPAAFWELLDAYEALAYPAGVASVRRLYECAECSQPDCNWRGECDGESCPACGGHVVPVNAGVIAGDGTGTALPPVSNEPRTADGVQPLAVTRQYYDPRRLAADARMLVQRLSESGFVDALYNDGNYSRTDLGQWCQSAAQYLAAMADALGVMKAEWPSLDKLQLQDDSGVTTAHGEGSPTQPTDAGGSHAS